MGEAQNRPTAGILFLIVGVIAITFNDLMIKLLSGGYPLHEIVFIRSSIGIMASLVFVYLEGGFQILRTKTPGLHLLRGIIIVISNMTYFAALAALPLADATALFFVAPLLITLLSIPLLGEKVGAWRLGAVVAGFVGVLLMMLAWRGDEAPADVPFIVLALPIVAALTYALNQIMTRKLGVASKASAMSVYIQLTFIVVSLTFFVVAGDGRFASETTNESLQFLLRAWVMPEGNDRWVFAALGLNSAVIGYCLGQAYRLADAATIAPFEYLGLPLAVFWGWLIWAEFPAPLVLAGIALIMGSGLFVFVRERIKTRPMIKKRVHRRY
ncbi:DMT family transporter [Lentibacter algarum]|uniref:DMT family transporter n=1 Tax=Lentibacter algarum TaxID=576131 RepID=UPI001C06BFE3|nr:DMT family transporter [Lentibacter algarum]MBU2981914.1 DMT family transporter [Lentibacter algarum]